MLQAEATIQDLSLALQRVSVNRGEVESALAQIPEEINLLDDDESEDASDATDREEVKFHFLSNINCGNASFLTPDEGFSYGYSSPCSSVYFARSPNKESSSLSQLSVIDTERGSVVPLLILSHSQITGIKKFPQNPYLLLSCESQQHIVDPRSNSIVWTSQFTSPITAACVSSSPFQLCSLVVELIFSFTATSDSLFECDYRGCSPVSILSTSDGTIHSLFSPFPQSLFYTMQMKHFQGGYVASLADVSDSWTQTGRMKVKWEDQEAWGVATAGLSNCNDMWMGIAHTSGVDVVCGRERKMLWDCRKGGKRSCVDEMKARIECRREQGPLIRPALLKNGNSMNYVCVCDDHSVALFDIDQKPHEVGRFDDSSYGHFNDEILLASQGVFAHVLATSNGIVVHQLVCSVYCIMHHVHHVLPYPNKHINHTVHP